MSMFCHHVRKQRNLAVALTGQLYPSPSGHMPTLRQHAKENQIAPKSRTFVFSRAFGCKRAHRKQERMAAGKPMPQAEEQLRTNLSSLKEELAFERQCRLAAERAATDERKKACEARVGPLRKLSSEQLQSSCVAHASLSVCLTCAVSFTRWIAVRSTPQRRP